MSLKAHAPTREQLPKSAHLPDQTHARDEITRFRGTPHFDYTSLSFASGCRAPPAYNLRSKDCGSFAASTRQGYMGATWTHL